MLGLKARRQLGYGPTIRVAAVSLRRMAKLGRPTTSIRGHARANDDYGWVKDTTVNIPKRLSSCEHLNGAQKSLVVLENADHFIFNQCRDLRGRPRFLTLFAPTWLGYRPWP
ncbi:MAG: hypothetical protein U0350_33435 [Caldilineaceae bacterium]